MLVMKFGGTSVRALAGIAALYAQTLATDTTPIIVVSALAGVTNLLVQLATAADQSQQPIIEQIQAIHAEWITAVTTHFKVSANKLTNTLIFSMENLSKISHITVQEFHINEILATGEQLIAQLISLLLNSLYTPAVYVCATECIYLKHDGVDFTYTTQATWQALAAKLHDNIVPIVTGFIATDQHGKLALLGRGGSDYSATIIGSAMTATEIQIWTDVDGIFAADPIIYPNAVLFTNLTYNEAMQIIDSGAKVLHKNTLLPAAAASIPVRVRNTFNSDHPGTLITH